MEELIATLKEIKFLRNEIRSKDTIIELMVKFNECPEKKKFCGKSSVTNMERKNMMVDITQDKNIQINNEVGRKEQMLYTRLK